MLSALSDIFILEAYKETFVLVFKIALSVVTTEVLLLPLCSIGRNSATLPSLKVSIGSLWEGEEGEGISPGSGLSAMVVCSLHRCQGKGGSWAG